jgi:hypothetical protein
MKLQSDAAEFYCFPESPSGEKYRCRPFRIGVPQEYIVTELSPEVRSAWSQVLLLFQEAGHKIIPVSLPTTKSALSAYYVLAPAEASSNLAKYDGVRYGTRPEEADGAEGVLFSKTRGDGFGAEVKRRILLGSYTLSAEAVDNYFIQAQKVRRLVQQDFDQVFRYPNLLHEDHSKAWKGKGVDILICPTAPTLSPDFKGLRNQTPLQQYMNDVFTVPASLAGLPALSVPITPDEDSGSPSVGIQIIGQFGADNLVLRAARCLEWLQERVPPVPCVLPLVRKVPFDLDTPPKAKSSDSRGSPSSKTTIKPSHVPQPLDSRIKSSAVGSFSIPNMYASGTSTKHHVGSSTPDLPVHLRLLKVWQSGDKGSKKVDLRSNEMRSEKGSAEGGAHEDLLLVQDPEKSISIHGASTQNPLAQKLEGMGGRPVSTKKLVFSFNEVKEDQSIPGS